MYGQDLWRRMEDGKNVGGRCREEVGLRDLDMLRANEMKISLGEKIEDSLKNKMIKKKTFFFSGMSGWLGCLGV